MNQLSVSKSPNNPSCADLMKMAQLELAAFLSAVTQLFGKEQAMLSAEDWLREFEAKNDLPTSTGEWRRITVNVSARLAKRVNAASLSSGAGTLADAAYATV